MPDGENLLIYTDHRLFSLNMQTRVINAVDLGKFEPSNIDICADGKVLVRALEKRRPHKSNNMLLLIDFQKMFAINANKNMASQHKKTCSLQ